MDIVSDVRYVLLFHTCCFYYASFVFFLKLKLISDLLVETPAREKTYTYQKHATFSLFFPLPMMLRITFKIVNNYPFRVGTT